MFEFKTLRNYRFSIYITTFSNRLIIDKYARFGSFFRSILLLLNTRISISFSNLLPHFRSSLPCDFWMHRYYYFLTLNSFFSKNFSFLFLSTVPDTPCPWTGYCYNKDESQGKKTNLNSWQNCLQSCQLEWNCESWTYVRQTRSCFLFNSKSPPLYKGLGCVSGHFECRVNWTEINYHWILKLWNKTTFFSFLNFYWYCVHC